MQEEFKSLSASLGKTLVNLMPLYTKLKQVQQLRKEGALNITIVPADITKPITDKFHFQMSFSSQLYNWIVFGFLMCPETLAIPGALELLSVALKDAYVTQIVKDVSIPLHPEYATLFKTWKSSNKNLKLSNQKKIIPEAAQECGSKGGSKHRDRRIYLRQELTSLVHLLKDNPQLIAPKFQMILCGLSLAKEEVFWYFRHQTPPPKPVAKKFVEDDFKDNRISELIFLIDELIGLIKKYKSIVQEYYVEYLKGADYLKLSELLDNNFMTLVGNGPSVICKSILDEIYNANINSNFKILRLNWFRTECALSSIQSTVPVSRIKEAMDRFNLIIHHTRFVDEIDDLLDKYANLKQLYYYKDLFYDIFDRAIKDGPNQPLHALSFIKLVADFPTNITQYNTDDRDIIGNDSVQLADKLVNDITARIAALINEIAKQNIIFDNQVADVNAAYPLLLKKKDYRPPKDFQNPEIPGTESEYKRRGQFDRLRLYQRNAYQLCAILNDIESIIVFDTKLTPREYLRDRFNETIRKFFRNAVATEVRDDKHVEKVLQRPSVFEKQLYIYLSVIKMAENFVDVDLGELVRELLLNEIWIPAVGKVGTFDWVVTDDIEFKYDGVNGTKAIGTIVNWYSDFVTKKLSIPGVCFSANRKGFVSRSGMQFRAELYADLDELKALIRLIGPYGARLIDREILKFILSNVTTIKEFVAHNKQALDELAAGYHNENACNDAMKKLRDCDTFVSKSVIIGNALYFREILHSAVRGVVEDKTPYIYDAINAMFKQYKANTYVQPEYLPADALANDAGLSLGTADQALKKILGRAFTQTEAPLVNALPYLYAASFTSTIWRDAQYKPLIEAHSNNANAISKCINSLIVASKSITSTERNELEITTLLKTMIEVSSVILLRMARGNNKSDKHTPVEFSSVIIFLDRVCFLFILFLFIYFLLI